MEKYDDTRVLKVSDVAKLLDVSITTVKNLWRDGRLKYKIMPNKQMTRVCTMQMVEAYRRGVLRTLIG